MIKISADTLLEHVWPEADFSMYEHCADDPVEFTEKCGIELKATVLAAIVAATDEYAKILKRHYPKEDMDEGFENTINTLLFENYVIDIKVSFWYS